MRPVACVGAGNVGRAWAIVFAKAGYPVRLYDSDPDVVEQHSMPMIRRNLADLTTAGLLQHPEEVAARIVPVGSVAEAVTDVVYVQESVREDAEVKAALFAQMDASAPADAVLASSTSAIPGSAFMEQLAGRDRCLVAHPVNPPYLIPLVEICPSPWTRPAVMQTCFDFMSQVGQSPIRLQREIPGFILNRLQFALAGEALHLVGEGYCSVDDVDKVLTCGLARRWAFIGPFEVAHLNSSGGYRGFMHGLGEMVRTVTQDVEVDYHWDDRLVDAVHAHLSERTPLAALADRQAWRDRQLMALAKHLASAASRETDGAAARSADAS